MTLPKVAGHQTPVDTQFTTFLFIIGLLLSLFILVFNFGPQGFLPFGMIIAGIAIQWKLRVKSSATATTGFTSKSLTWILGGLILVLSINYLLGTILSVSFLQPPISASAYAASSQYANFPIYIYTLLFAISEEYLFRAVIMYWIYNSIPIRGLPQQFIAVGGSSILWTIFHFAVYGTAPLVLMFVLFTGIVFGFVTLYSRNILVASTVHGINNLLAAGLTVIGVT